MKVKFLSDRVVQDSNAGTNKEVRFRAGDVVDLPDASANHWITRGVAEGHEPADKKSAGDKK